MIVIVAMDYDKQQVFKIHLSPGCPSRTSVKVYNHLDEELAITTVKLGFDTVAGVYVAKIFATRQHGQQTEHYQIQAPIVDITVK